MEGFAITYGDLTLNRAIKMETNTAVQFTTEGAGTLTVVTYSTKTSPAIKINNQSYPVSANGATTINIPAAGTYTITKDTTNTYLYYLSFIES